MLFEVNDALEIWLRFILVLALGDARLCTERNYWTGLQRESGREKEEGEISHLGKTTKS